MLHTYSDFRAMIVKGNQMCRNRNAHAHHNWLSSIGLVDCPGLDAKTGKSPKEDVLHDSQCNNKEPHGDHTWWIIDKRFYCEGVNTKDWIKTTLRAHSCEVLQLDTWICVNCGETFPRKASMGDFPEEAIIEGECEAILDEEDWEAAKRWGIVELGGES